VADRVPTRIAVSVALGTLLNPLNSSMIAVGLVALQGEFHVSLATSTWLISSFYLAASVGQPVMGRLADRYGPRRIFISGLALVGVTGILVLFAPGFGWVVAARVLQAIGTSVGFPAGLALIRRLAGGRPPAGTLGVLSAANSASASFGPVLGGALVAVAGWRGIFAVNIPLAAAGLLLARRWLPADPPGASEPRARVPLHDLRELLGRPALIGVLVQQVSVQCVFYLVFFGLPQWLERIRGYPAAVTGLLMLPIALGTLLIPLAARVVRRYGAPMAMLIGSAGLLGGAVGLLSLGNRSGAVSLVAVGALLGLPNAFYNLGLQAGLYAAAPPAQTGTAAGLFQTGRYVGAILSTAVLGAVYGGAPSTAGLHRTALIVAVSAVVLTIAVPLTPVPGGRHRVRPASRSAPETSRPVP
jgi:predicted MFS family arabinose efflux permease